jgi:hypothetical protein
MSDCHLWSEEVRAMANRIRKLLKLIKKRPLGANQLIDIGGGGGGDIVRTGILCTDHSRIH